MSMTPVEIWLAYNDACNRSDLGSAARFISADLCVLTNGANSVVSVEDDMAAMGRLLAWYPDYAREVIDTAEVGDRAVVEWVMRGTPSAPGAAVLNVVGCSVIWTEAGVITRAHLYYDGGALDAVLRAGDGASPPN